MSANGLSDMKFILGFQVQRHWNWKVAFVILVVACLAIQAGGYLLRDTILQVGVYGEPV